MPSLLEPAAVVGKCMTFDKGPPLSTKGGRAVEKAWLFLDQIKREKGVWWMPWQ